MPNQLGKVKQVFGFLNLGQDVPMFLGKGISPKKKWLEIL